MVNCVWSAPDTAEYKGSAEVKISTAVHLNESWSLLVWRLMFRV